MRTLRPSVKALPKNAVPQHSQMHDPRNAQRIHFQGQIGDFRDQVCLDVLLYLYYRFPLFASEILETNAVGMDLAHAGVLHEAFS